MKKTLKYIGLSLIAIFVIIQFFRPDRTNPESEPKKDIAQVEQLPADVSKILKMACYDCHSHETKWPWYTNVAPASWITVDHVEEGRKELNFSLWDSYPEDKKLHKLEECMEEVEEGEMPLIGYVKMHAEADLSDEQKATLFTWIKERLGDYQGHKKH